jgi:hypothetical protein
MDGFIMSKFKGYDPIAVQQAADAFAHMMFNARTFDELDEEQQKQVYINIAGTLGIDIRDNPDGSANYQDGWERGTGSRHGADESVEEQEEPYKKVAGGMDKEAAEKYAKQNGGQVTIDDAEDNKDDFNPKFMVVKKENEAVEEDNTGYGDLAVACPKCKHFNDPNEGESNPNKRRYTCDDCGEEYTYGNWTPQREAKVYEQLAAYRKAKENK